MQALECPARRWSKLSEPCKSKKVKHCRHLSSAPPCDATFCGLHPWVSMDKGRIARVARSFEGAIAAIAAGLLFAQPGPLHTLQLLPLQLQPCRVPVSSTREQNVPAPICTLSRLHLCTQSWEDVERRHMSSGTSAEKISVTSQSRRKLWYHCRGLKKSRRGFSTGAATLFISDTSTRPQADFRQESSESS